MLHNPQKLDIKAKEARWAIKRVQLSILVVGGNLTDAVSRVYYTLYSLGAAKFGPFKSKSTPGAAISGLLPVVAHF